jgi:hypothetical protein
VTDKVRRVVQFPSSMLSTALGTEGAIGSGGSVPGMGATPMLQHEPGGSVLRIFQHPAFQTLERLFRVLPEEGWFSSTVRPDNPVQFPVGSFEVPKNMALWLFEYKFNIYRFSGVDAGDFVLAEDGRFADAIGYDVTVSGRRPANIQYQLDPIPVSFSRPQFDAKIGQQSTAAQFNRNSAPNFAATASPGLSLLPMRKEVMGASNGPFTFVVKEGDTVNLNAVMWRPFQTPVACLEGKLAGYLMQIQVSEALVNRLRPR